MEGMKIRNEKGEIVPMTFSDSQRMIWKFVAPQLDDAEGKLWFIVLKGRQIYATTFFECLTFLRTIEKANTNSLVIAQDVDSAVKIFGMAQRFYDYLPLPKLGPSKKKEIEFNLPGGRSEFRVISAGTAAKGRGTTQTCVHCSEVAFWPHAEVMTGLFQTMPDLPDTLWVLESTANGMVGTGAMFHQQWKMAVSGDSQMIPIFIPWYIMPKYRDKIALPEDEWDEEEKILVEQFSNVGLDGHSLMWRRKTIATKLQGMLEMFHQEYPSTPDEAFISSGLPAFDSLALLKQANNIRPPMVQGVFRDGKLLRQARGEVSVWVEPKDNHDYFIGIDTSEGLRDASGKPTGDFSCAQVVDMTSLEQVAIIHGAISPWDMAKMCADIGKWYNTAMLNVEVKSSGHAVQDYLIRIFQYPRLHPWKGKQDRTPHAHTVNRLWGWDTNIYSRPLLIESGRRAINRGMLTLHDMATLDEIRHFSRSDDGHYEAVTGHDDRVMALLLALRSGEENHLDMKASYWNPELSEPDLRGVRIIDSSNPNRMTVNRVHRMLQMRERAQRAAKHWTQL